MFLFWGVLCLHLTPVSKPLGRLLFVGLEFRPVPSGPPRNGVQIRYQGFLGWVLLSVPNVTPCLSSCCRGLPTDRYMWSDATGLQECTKASTKPPSLQWTWVSPPVL